MHPSASTAPVPTWVCLCVCRDAHACAWINGVHLSVGLRGVPAHAWACGVPSEFLKRCVHVCRCVCVYKHGMAQRVFGCVPPRTAFVHLCSHVFETRASDSE